MVITTQVFEAYLKCPLKCWLLFTREPGTGNTYSDWRQKSNDSYRDLGVEQLLIRVKGDEHSVSRVNNLNIKTAKWKYASYVKVKNDSLESNIHVIEHIPPEGRGRSSQYIPYRYIFTNKLTKDDKMLVAYDAFVLSETFNREVDIGKIIHGDNFTALKVNTSALRTSIRKLTSKINSLSANEYKPDLILNRHCSECIYQTRCRQKAIENDELTLLAGMSVKERIKLNSTGIFTITQLSYTFRPRRHPKRLQDKPEKYHHSLKALSIRENKIHIVGSPELKIEGTPVYIDVESLPDQDFYYLVGVRFNKNQSAVQHSLWAETPHDEKKIWNEFICILETVQLPLLICYGSYETVYLRTMCDRYGEVSKDSKASKAIATPLNILSVIYSRIYFPVPSNGLKEIAGYCGFKWSESQASGIQSIVWRETWETSKDYTEQEKLIQYNTDDCTALEVITQMVVSLQLPHSEKDGANENKIVDISKLKRRHPYGFKRNNFAIPDLDTINNAAYWDYQRERVYVKSNSTLKRLSKINNKIVCKQLAINKTIHIETTKVCFVCNSKKVYPYVSVRRVVTDLNITAVGIKRVVSEYIYKRYRCENCNKTFATKHHLYGKSKYGNNLISYALYQCIELRLPVITVEKSLNRLFGLNFSIGTVNRFKSHAGIIYKPTYDALVSILCNGKLLHADESKISLKESSGFVWILTSMEEVVYIYTESREGECIHALLNNFKGVLVSDFYAAYESINCPQQKCLIHLIRDINDDLYKHPYDDGLKIVAQDFTNLVKPIIETVDRYGLKKYHLNKHLSKVAAFYERLSSLTLTTETAIKLRVRLEKNKCVLFTFLQYDGIPWNNNNAEHAVKAFAMLRQIINGLSTEKRLQDYLILLSISETCKYKGIDFLDFLRSGETDINTFATKHMRKRSTNKSHHTDGPDSIDDTMTP
jgi:predicted RecB family nuclease